MLEAKHAETLETLKSGVINEDIMAVLKETAEDLEDKFSEQE